MDHRIIGLIIAACIIFVSTILIVIKYFYRNKENKLNKKIKSDADKIQHLSSDKVSDSKKD